MKPLNVQATVEAIENKNLRTLSRCISAAENQAPYIIEVLEKLYSKIGNSRVIGITGSPGAGKSTLLSHFVNFLRAQEKTVAVLAVDPNSPFTGGAILGDRIRLTHHFNDPGVYIRSLSTRGQLGGLSLATRQAIHLIDAFKFDYILVESVGVGQNEVDIRRMVDLTLLLLTPEWGDSIQSIKAGIMEIAEFFVINKADRPGADKLIKEIKATLHMADKDQIPVMSCSTEDESSQQALYKAIEEYFIVHKMAIHDKRTECANQVLLELLEVRVQKFAKEWVHQHEQNKENPYALLNSLLDSKALNFLKESTPNE